MGLGSNVHLSGNTIHDCERQGGTTYNNTRAGKSKSVRVQVQYVTADSDLVCVEILPEEILSSSILPEEAAATPVDLV